ncbi:HAD-IA family hydrolase [Actinoplanes sp. NBRC 103695]|uniref:HAD family hydrolase n=1 Tax=Actinoplanes sp. NBRC 103695 TaxID=3032202 RepID=UPI0024A240E3|nr:HAD-IA family hydrolase [Actinoplanes sp. NBRC 103695]GLY93411.1 hypothetical protein Acsp02_06670 [Actinoplanes sp. NBRC 103695]
MLFDAGGVLTRPVGGRWNPRHDFESVVVRHHPEVDTARFPEAIAAGQRFLDAGETTPVRADYHRAVLVVLGVAEPTPALLTELEAPPSGPVVELYPDVPRTLERLHAAGIRMSVVSDNWAGLEAGLDGLGIAHFFAGFVVSELMGCTKPDPRMYAAGSALIDLPPHECLFVDDDPELVAAAVALGYRGVALVRDGEPPSGAGWVRTLDALATRWAPALPPASGSSSCAAPPSS